MTIHCSEKVPKKFPKIVIGITTTLLLTGVSAVYQNAHAHHTSKKVTVQTAMMHDADDASLQKSGAGILTRSPNEVLATISTSELVEGAYTVWWVIFNHPSNCSAEVGPDADAKCGAEDLYDQDVAASVFYATGFVTTTGKAQFNAHLKSGSVPRSADIAVGRGGIDGDNGVTPGLRRSNGLNAEIHMVVRSHGAIVPSLVDEQTGAFNGGCNLASDPPGPNICKATQEVAFPPARDRSS